MDERAEFIKAIKAFNEAAQKLNEVWGNIQWINNEGAELAQMPNKMYPFEESFDKVAYDVKLWAEDSIETIQNFKQA
jgi:phage shock protein A